MIIFIENISITFKIFKGRNFYLFVEKGVDSPNKIPGKTIFRAFQEKKPCQNYTFFKKWKNVQLKVLAFIPLQYLI